MSPALIFDIVVIAALLISAVIAFLRGFIREVLTIFGVLGGLLAAYLSGPGLSQIIAGWIGVEDGEEVRKLFDLVPYPVVADVVAYGSIFIIVVILLSVVSHYLANMVKAIGLGAVDRTFGVLFGILRGIVLLGLLYLPVYLLMDEEGRLQYLENSRARVYVEATAAYMARFIPESLSIDDEDKEKGRSLADSARERLQELEVLRDMKETDAQEERDDQKAAGEKENAPSSSPAPDSEEGYDNKERDNLERLIEGNINE